MLLPRLLMGIVGAVCAGESYAGHYVPAVASRVFHASKSGEVEPPINLQARFLPHLFCLLEPLAQPSLCATEVLPPGFLL